MEKNFEKLSIEEMNEITAGVKDISFGCGLALGLFGLAIVGACIGTGGVGLIVAQASLYGSAISIIPSCS